MSFPQAILLLLVAAMSGIWGHNQFPHDSQTKLAEAQAITIVQPKPYAISTNIVFVVDASSTINRYGNIKRRFGEAWNYITNKFAKDELYFSVYVFHDKNREKFRDWVEAGGPPGKKEFQEARAWVSANTGIASYGQKPLGLAIRKVNHLNKNYNERMRLTVVLISDGGFTEAAKYAPKKNETHYKPIIDTVIASQIWRVDRGMAEASILTVGIENRVLWSSSTKRPDSECQAFLKDLGTRYGGGYVLVRSK